MHLIIFFLLISIGCLLLVSIPFIAKAGISKQNLIYIFLFKSLILVMCSISLQNYNGGQNDYFNYNSTAQKEMLWLKYDPKGFIKELYTSKYESGYSNVFGSTQSYWNDLGENLMVKPMAVLNLLTKGNYLANAMPFIIFVFVGSIALFRVFRDIYPGNDLPILIGCFFLPSMMFFTSAIHKDAVCFALLACLFYSLYFGIAKKFTAKRILMLLGSFFLLIIFRNYIPLVVVPWTIAFIISIKRKIAPLKIFSIVGISIFLVMMIWYWITPTSNGFHIIADKLNDFKELGIAKTQLPTADLQPTPKSILGYIPQAFSNAFLRPHVFEKSSNWLIPFGVEGYFYMMVFGLFLFSGGFKYKNKPMTWFMVIVSLCLIMVIGFTVPNMGSIIRYRSIYLPFLITPLLVFLAIKLHLKVNKL